MRVFSPVSPLRLHPLNNLHHQIKAMELRHDVNALHTYDRKWKRLNIQTPTKKYSAERMVSAESSNVTSLKSAPRVRILLSATTAWVGGRMSYSPMEIGRAH